MRAAFGKGHTVVDVLTGTTITLSAYNLRNLCIQKNWYTAGDNEDYWSMFKMLTKDGLAVEITTELLEKIANDIYNHSDEKACTDGYLADIPGIMYDLAKICDVTFWAA